jgi:hypothetical protein
MLAFRPYRSITGASSGVPDFFASFARRKGEDSLIPPIFFRRGWFRGREDFSATVALLDVPRTGRIINMGSISPYGLGKVRTNRVIA